ncbi:hypothetical protein OAO10_05060 [Luminiphilus sp.]|nr:hypothetical protein [Luminiphilus sp.]
MSAGLVSNIANFYVVELLKVITPLITLPIILSKISLSDYGVLSVYVAIASIFCIIIDGNLNYTFVNRCLEIRKGQSVFPTVWRRTFLLRGSIFITSLVAGLILSIINPNFDTLVLCFFIFCTGLELFIPVWYFQFLNDLRLLSFCTIISKSILLVGVIFFLDEENVFLLYPMMLGLGHAFAAIVLSYVASVRSVYGLMREQDGIQRSTVKESNGRSDFWLFLSKVLAGIYTNLPLFLLQHHGYQSIAGAYSVAVRVTSPVKTLSVPVVQGLYPYLSSMFVAGSRASFRSDLPRRLQLLTCVGSALLAFVIYVFSGTIVEIFRLGDSSQLVPMIQMMCLIPPIIVIGNVYGFQNLAAMRRTRIIALASFCALLTAGVFSVLLDIEAPSFARDLILYTELTFTLFSLLAIWSMSPTKASES